VNEHVLKLLNLYVHCDITNTILHHLNNIRIVFPYCLEDGTEM
jgi:hypothetical protein